MTIPIPPPPRRQFCDWLVEVAEFWQTFGAEGDYMQLLLLWEYLYLQGLSPGDAVLKARTPVETEVLPCCQAPGCPQCGGTGHYYHLKEPKDA